VAERGRPPRAIKHVVLSCHTHFRPRGSPCACEAALTEQAPPEPESRMSKQRRQTRPALRDFDRLSRSTRDGRRQRVAREEAV
jgi:hypothetical protein